ncbi:putative serine protease 47 [Paramacrobiotus metropolitanus]|uniref:putative serine protease 47 n=1 Tax=Paramacrobiotus metropolitanus TaxID=2943436 RepID=UPI002445ADA9|nr:putative serine protease 47 [Paramacrobiotus metropolitanus]
MCSLTVNFGKTLLFLLIMDFLFSFFVLSASWISHVYALPAHPSGRAFPSRDKPVINSRQFGGNLNRPPSPGANKDDVLLTAAGIHGLLGDKFPVQDDPDMSGKFPGINSAPLTVGDMVNNKVQFNQNVQSLPLTGGICIPVNHTEINGKCANVFDVVINRKCADARTERSNNCQNNEVCCFKLSTKDVVESSFDQIPCGLRRTPELAQRELQRIADEENFDQVPMRILGGLEAFQNEICWQAAILVDGKYVCGGVVINSRNVMTAGHCLNDVEEMKQISVVTGSKNIHAQGKCAETFAAADVNFHDSYDPRSLVNDMAVIKLDRPITNTNCTCRICMPEGSLDTEASGKLSCLVSGYGTTEPGKTPADIGPLNIANVNVIVELPDNRQCTDRLHLSSAIPKNFLLDQSMICAIGDNPAKPSDTCDLDGGSPLVCRMNPDVPDVYTLVGLSSWGLPCGRNIVKDATNRDVLVPTVYSHVRPAINWINSISKV